jgi:transcription termination factor Rho
MMADGYGFLRSSDYNYLFINVPIRLFGLKTGDTVKGGAPSKKEKIFC